MTVEKTLPKKYWTEDEISYLERRYTDAASIEELAKKLHRTPAAVRNKVIRLNLMQGKKLKPWTKEDLDVLEDSWGRSSYTTIARRLKRTPEAVRMKAIRLGYASFQTSCDGMTVCELADALGVDYKKVRRWIANRGLPSFTIKISEKQRKIMINLDAFWKWLKANQDLVDLSKVERGTFGAEPRWVAEKRKSDYHNRQSFIKNRAWTKTEENRLLGLVNEYKYTYRDIAGMLGRSEASINQRLIDLGVKQRPLKAEREAWSREDDALLIESHEKGLTGREIAETLDRTHNSIKGRLQKLKKGGYLRITK